MNPTNESGSLAGLKGWAFPKKCFCREYRDVYNYFTEKPPFYKSVIYDTMVKSLVGVGLWSRIDVFYFRACHINTGGEAHINWKNPGTFNSTAFNNPIHTADQGLLYNGTTQYTNLNWTPSVNGVNYTQNSASMIMYIRTNVNTNSGHGISSSISAFIMPRTSDVSYIRINDAGSSSGANTNGSGLYVNTRTATAVKLLYRNGIAIINGITASTGVPTKSPFEGAYNNGSDIATGFRADQVALHAYADGFSQADVSAFTNIIEAAMDSLGTGIIP